MRVWIWAALLLAGCAMPTKDAPMADALRISGSWIGASDPRSASCGTTRLDRPSVEERQC